MQERDFASGETIYEEGDPGDAVFIVRMGEVEVLRNVGGKPMRLSVLGGGAIFGEMGVIRSLSRSTTTRAMGGGAKLVVIPRDDFLAMFRDDNPLALEILRLLCERLTHADDKLLQHRLYAEGAPFDEIERVRLLGASAEVEKQIGMDGIVVANLPFRVGRHTKPSDVSADHSAGLFLYLPDSGDVSPLHFSIEPYDGRLALRDLASHLGTVVNGVRVAHFEQSEIADLHFGENTVQAGGLESPFKFHVIVERAKD